MWPWSRRCRPRRSLSDLRWAETLDEEQIEDARGEALRLGLELEHLVRIDRDQLGEGSARLAVLLERHSFDGLEADELESVAGAPRRAAQKEAREEMEPLDHRPRDDGVADLRVVVRGRVDEEARAVRLHVEDAAGGDELSGGDVDRRSAAAVVLTRTRAVVSSAAAAARPAAPATGSTAAAAVELAGLCFVSW